MSCSSNADCTCCCCAGTRIQTPQTVSNRPGLSAVAYRTGTWTTFKESMLARLSSSDYRALQSLQTRSDDDFTIALLDATAIVLDVLTFYQERLVNESYLRTAGQLRSLIELSRLIAYQPAPGVSASTYLAFTLKTAPGQPSDPSTVPITIPKGTQVQSVPAQGQAPQTFETSADIQAKPDWNALPVQTGEPWLPSLTPTSMYLSGTVTKLQPGDAILIVGDERANASETEPGWEVWDIRVVLTVEVDNQKNRTRITWNQKLGSPDGTVAPSNQHPKLYAFRQKASLFGYNAIDPDLLNTDKTSITNKLDSDSATPPNYSWHGFSMNNTIDLDSTYPQIVQGSWVALVLPEDYNPNRSLSGFINLYRVSSVSSVSRSDFALSAKISRIQPDSTTYLSQYLLRTTLALVQSEELVVGAQPLAYPLYGTVLDLADYRPDLIGLQVVALSGTRQKIAVSPEAGATLSFIPSDDPGQSVQLNPGDVLTLIAPPTLIPGAGGAASTSANGGTNSANPASASSPASDWGSPATQFTLSVEDGSGRTGTVQIQNATSNPTLGDLFSLVPSDKKDPVVSEYALVSSVSIVPVAPNNAPYPHTQLQLISPLANCYDRATTTVNANIGPATQGQSVTEILGSGNAAAPNQRFSLKQAPLTFIQASTPTGRESTLTVRANSAAWTEMPSLYSQGSTKQIFTTLNQPGGKTDVLFGDGVEGALLPTGQNNLQATYRIGLGSAGNVAAGTLTTLMDRPLGVSGVTNPQDASGGQDAEALADIRANAPQTVLTLGRAVSITDYQNFARTFAGIAKAYALWIPSGPGRGVFITVAGVDGVALRPGNPTLVKLVAALQNYGNPLIPIRAVTYAQTLFNFSADLQYDPAYDPAQVKAQAFQAVSQAFSFSARDFGQGVSVDQVAAIIQAVTGVVAVNVTGLNKSSSSTGGDISSRKKFTLVRWAKWLRGLVILKKPLPDSTTRICSYLPVADSQSMPSPAEILVLDPAAAPSSWGVLK